MKSLIIASNNKGKLLEIQLIIGNDINLITLKEISIFEEIPEPYFTFEENAKAKAKYVYDKTGIDCFAEDSGLVVPSLGGAPGVFSARYAGRHGDDRLNNEKLLLELKDSKDRSAYYQSVICCCLQGEFHYFKGKCEGSITFAAQGEGGFGYDPLFVPSGYDHTFGNLSITIKNKISHRAKALDQFREFWESKQ